MRLARSERQQYLSYANYAFVQEVMQQISVVRTIPSTITLPQAVNLGIELSLLMYSKWSSIIHLSPHPMIRQTSFVRTILAFHFYSMI
jgi:hypothetical protein